MIVVGDRKTPAAWAHEGVEFVAWDAPPPIAADLAARLPFDSYSRKNIGYLAAIQGGAPFIVETDDDNFPYDTFGLGLEEVVRGRVALTKGWINVYRAYTEARIWPRGLPLEVVAASLHEPLQLGKSTEIQCRIQQFLADGDPDVDAIYRLVDGREVTFRGAAIILRPGTYSPFNSQNTVWWPLAYRLLYLPSHVSFRVTDNWRGLVATAVAETQGWSIAFLPPTVRQERNPHNLLKDFADEVPAYLENARILEHLITAVAPAHNDADALRAAYEELLAMGLVPKEELELVDAWNDALDEIGAAR
jgi:STELLO glycosyltransferases